MTAGEGLVRGTIWLVIICYAISVALQVIQGGNAPRRLYLARLFWTGGCLLFIMHAVTAFHVHYDWDHGQALAETARQSLATTGVAAGWGLYLNYLFGIIWLVDAGYWCQVRDKVYSARGKVVALAIHLVFLFMFVNGGIIFVTGAVRFYTTAILLLLGAWVAYQQYYRRHPKAGEQNAC